MATYETLQKIVDLIMQTYKQTIMALPIERRPDNMKTVGSYTDAAMHYAAFCAFGRQIFHFNSEIVEQFRKTDIDEVMIDNLRFPYEVFYMSFGKQSDLTVSNSNYVVDGTYISMFSVPVVQDRSLQILLTTVGKDITDTDNSPHSEFDWIFKPEEHYYLSIPMNDPSQPILRAVEKALSAEMEDKQRSIEKEPSSLEVPGKVVNNRRPESLKREMRELEEGYPAFREALKLIINGLCYISAYSDDIETKWPADTPSPLLEKIINAKKPKEATRTESKLISMGYTKIHFCGKAFERLNKNSLPTGREVKAHWRRGHWRNQPWGPKLSSRKLIWIMPVIVHKDKAESLAEAGHIYYVSEEKE